MPARVGVRGEVQTTNGATPPETGVGGAWAAGTVNYQTYGHLKVGGTPVIYEATCKFTWSGGNQKADSSKPHDPVDSTVTLTAKTKRLQKGANNVLVHGDSEQDQYGNKLQVNATGPLRTD
jgi:hypothetical protein